LALGKNTTGSQNNAFGYLALEENTFGGQNNAFGFHALQKNTTGTYNQAFGYQALQKNTTGTYNQAFGSQALGNNVYGRFNLAIGHQSLYNLNGTGNDYPSTDTLASGSWNTAIGYPSMTDLTTGIFNTAVGHNSGRDVTTGKYNTAIGAETKIGSTSNGTVVNPNIQYSTAIGFNAAVTESNRVVLGTANETVVCPGNINLAAPPIMAYSSYTASTNNKQIGYHAYATDTFTGTITSNQTKRVAKISLPSGVWILQGNIQINQTDQNVLNTIYIDNKWFGSTRWFGDVSIYYQDAIIDEFSSQRVVLNGDNLLVRVNITRIDINGGDWYLNVLARSNGTINVEYTRLSAIRIA
jgi:hypothetical protein